MKVEELQEDKGVGGLLGLGDGGGDGASVLLLALSLDALVAGVVLSLLGLLCDRLANVTMDPAQQLSLRMTSSSSSSLTTL